MHTAKKMKLENFRRHNLFAISKWFKWDFKLFDSKKSNQNKITRVSPPNMAKVGIQQSKTVDTKHKTYLYHENVS